MFNIVFCIKGYFCLYNLSIHRNLKKKANEKNANEILIIKQPC